MELNSNQKRYLLISSEMIKPYELYKIFDLVEIDSESLNWLLNQKITIQIGINGWWDLFMDGVKYTSLNFNVYKSKLDKLIEIGANNE